MSDIKPVIVIPRGSMTRKNLEMLRENGCCVVESKEPESVTTVPLINGNYELDLNKK